MKQESSFCFICDCSWQQFQYRSCCSYTTKLNLTRFRRDSCSDRGMCKKFLGFSKIKHLHCLVYRTAVNEIFAKEVLHPLISIQVSKSLHTLLTAARSLFFNYNFRIHMKTCETSEAFDGLEEVQKMAEIEDI